MQAGRPVRYAILFLTLAAATSARADAPRLSADKAQQICERVVQLANAGELETAVVPFAPAHKPEDWTWPGHTQTVADRLSVDFNRDGKIDRLARVVNSGPCVEREIVNLDDPSSTTAYITLPSGEEDDLRWAGWNEDDHFLFVDDEPVVVTAKLGSWRSSMSLVSWFGEGRKRPLCSVLATGDYENSPVASETDQVCRAVVAERTDLKRWQDADETVLDTIRERNRWTSNAFVLRIDLNLDGSRDVLALGTYDAGVGCRPDGVSSIYVLSDDRSLVVDSKLQSALSEGHDGHGKWGPLPYGRHLTDRYPRIFKFSQKPYILAPSSGGTSVISVWGNKRRKWCTIKQTPKFRIVRYH